MNSKWILALLCFLLVFIQINAYSEEIYLKNGDRLTGDIIEESERTITLRTEATGEISVNKDFVQRIARAGEKQSEYEPKEPQKAIWQRKVSLGYNKSSGNTKASQLFMNLAANRKIEHVNELTLEGRAFYSSSNEKMDARKCYGSARYAFSFGKEKMWYNLYKLEADHDRFASINYRIIPSIGVGYWLYDLPDFKLMAELGFGLEHTVYRDQTEDSDEAILIPRAFLEKEIYDNLKIAQHLILYPTLDDFGDYRVHSETKLTSLLNEKLSVNLSLIDDYNSEPAENVKKNDLQLISSIEYAF